MPACPTGALAPILRATIGRNGAEVTRRELAAVLVLGAAACIAVLLIGLAAGSPQFSEAMLANTAASFVGVVVGIPVALAIISRQRKAETDARDRDAERRRIEVLQAVRAELRGNLSDLADRTDGQRWLLMSPPLSIEVWRALSASGDLQVVHDVQLLGAVARAYRFIESVRQLEKLAIEQAQWPLIHQTVLRHLVDHGPIAKASMDEAMVPLEQALVGRPGDARPRIAGARWRGPLQP